MWKDIKNYGGYYKISNKGRVKSLFFQNNVWNEKYKREKVLKHKGYTPDLLSRGKNEYKEYSILD